MLPRNVVLLLPNRHNAKRTRQQFWPNVVIPARHVKPTRNKRRTSTKRLRSRVMSVRMDLPLPKSVGFLVSVDAKWLLSSFFSVFEFPLFFLLLLSSFRL